MEPERSSPAPARPGPRALLNILLRDGVQHVLDNLPHADFFRNAVSCAVVNDYRDYVPAGQDMCLSVMLERTDTQYYLSLAAFRADLQLLYQNAAAYNGRNGGRHAYEPVIHWAKDMIAAAEEQLHLRMPALQAAEVELQQLQRQADVATMDADIAAPPANSPSKPPPEALVPPPAAPCKAQQQSAALSPVEAGSGSPRAGGDAGNGSAGQQSSSPSTGSGDGSHSGLEALLAACELAAEQESATPRGSVDGAPGCDRGMPAPAAASAPERRSYPGCGSPAKLEQLQQHQVVSQAIVLLTDANEPTQKPQQQVTVLPEEPAGSSEGGGMALCCARSGGAEAGASTVQPGIGGATGGTAACTSYLTSNAFKNRRHKSKVYIKPNKVVYLPTTFVEEEFDVTALPLDCELKVEADGVQMDETFKVTIKAVPRQGLSTMYCMTNVMRFQQQYLNWQIYNWTRIDNSNIKIHLQSPSPSQSQLQRPDLDRCASMPEVGRTFAARNSEDGGVGAPRNSAASLKRKSDTGRYNATKVERRVVVEPSREMPMELRLSSNGYVHRPSPIPESPPASPQRRISTSHASLPPRGPAGGQVLPPRHPLHPSHYHPHQLYQPLSYQLQPLRAPNHNMAAKPDQQSGNDSGGGNMVSLDAGLPLAMHQAHLASGQPARVSANGGARGAQIPRQAHSLEQQLQDLSQQLQMGGQGEMPSLAALQFALATALQQQQQCHGGGVDAAVAEPSNAEHERLVQQQQRGARGGSCLDLHVPTRRDSGELRSGEYAGFDLGVPRDCMGGSFGRGQILHAAPRGGPGPYPHHELQRRHSHGRQVAAGHQPRHTTQLQHTSETQQALDVEEIAAADEQHAMRLARGSGHGGNPNSFPGPGLGRIVFDIGAGGAGAGRGNARRGNSSSGTAADGMGLSVFPGGFDLSGCSTVELMSLLSPTKRYKISMGASQLQGFEGSGPSAVSNVELGLLEAMGWRGGNGLPPSAEAALAALRSGPFPPSALGGRPFMQMGPELMGQLM